MWLESYKPELGLSLVKYIGTQSCWCTVSRERKLKLKGRGHRYFRQCPKFNHYFFMASLRKEIPAQMQEWKWKHRLIFRFRSKLLRFLEKQFDRAWVKTLIESTELKTVEVEWMGIDYSVVWLWIELSLYCTKDFVGIEIHFWHPLQSKVHLLTHFGPGG